MRKIKVELSPASIENAIRDIEQYQDDVEQKCQEVCEKLASIGAVGISLGFSRAIYTGDNSFNVEVEKADVDGKSGYIVSVTGGAVLFIEFGAGVTYAKDNVHPLSAQFGMGVGTYPGQKHAFDENGWYLPGPGHQHTYGSPPNMPVYNTAKDLEAEVEKVVREVFG